MDIKMSGFKTDIVYGSYRGAIAHLFVVIIKYYLLYVEEDTLYKDDKNENYTFISVHVMKFCRYSADGKSR